MIIPRKITRATLSGLFAPNETHVVRLIVHDVSNESRYLLRCRSREYSFERSPQVGRHILDIPLSVYMEGANTKYWRDNTSIAEDIRLANRSVTIQVLPISQAEIEVSNDTTPESPLPELRRLLEILEAPEPVQQCLSMIENGDDVEVVRAFVDEIGSSLESDQTDESDSPPAAALPAVQTAPGETPAEAPEQTTAETPAPAPKPAAKKPAKKSTKKAAKKTAKPKPAANEDLA